MSLHVSNQILDYLIECQKLSLDMKNILLLEQDLSKRSLESLLLEIKILTEDELIDLFVHFRQCTVVELKKYEQSMKDLVAWFPYEVLERYGVVPIEYDSDISMLTIAMSDVSDLNIQDTLSHHIPQHCKMKTVMAKKSDILLALQKNKPLSPMELSSQHQMDGAVINQFLYQIITQGVHSRASDIHFQPEKFFIRIQFRCDGMLKTILCFHHSLWPTLCVQLKILSGMDIAETRLAQDGRFTLPITGRRIDIRMACHPTVHGENIVLRLLDSQKSLISLKELGYSPSNLAQIEKMIQQPEGLIIITGPTGSGKTTSLYSMITALPQERLNIMTLEEPIEYDIPEIRQSEVREKSNFTFVSGMHSILRQDPDVILIGEVRDENTADMAIRAGMTGHLVLTTLHTTRALSAIYRLKELNVATSLLAGILNGIIAQRLIRLLCSSCKEQTQLTDQQSCDVKIWPQTKVFKAVGCQECNFSGYKGRKAIAEVITMNEELESLILDQAPYPMVQRALFQRGFKTLASDGLEFVLRGETSVEELHRVIGV